MGRQCIFCPEKATTKEHCIPKWMADRTGLRGAFLETTGVIGHTFRRKQPISFRSHREKLLCEGCQKHFKQLEDEVIPVYERLERYEETTFQWPEQMALAKWGLKTAICCLFADRHDHTVPEEDRYGLRQTGVLPVEAWVVYVRWNGVAGLAVDEFAVSGPDGPIPYAYGFTLATRRVATKCVRFYAKSGEPTEDLFPGQLLQVWPPSDPNLLTWPPTGAWDDFTLLDTYLPL